MNRRKSSARAHSKMPGKLRVLFAFGTRPEAIKLAPVMLKMREDTSFDPIVCVSGQHREMLDQVLETFGILPDHDLAVMRPNQTLAALTAAILEGVDRIIRRTKPDLVMVQGDTTTAFVAAAAAFYRRVPVAHVEAGLRTNDFSHPFPEEFNRVLIDKFAEFCFAPTKLNRRALLREGVPWKRITVTGNTGIDALLIVRDRVQNAEPGKWNHHWRRAKNTITETGKPLVLITMHRRESFGERMRAILAAITRTANRHPDWTFIYPVHLNPNVRRPVKELLRGLSNVHLISALPYEPFVFLMNRAQLIVTDSGGIQEEAPSLRKPVIVLREKTERQEAIKAGAMLSGNTGEGLEGLIERLMRGSGRIRPRQGRNPYGDGHASDRILETLRHYRT